MDEIWKAVVGYEGLYEVSREGRIRSLERDVPVAAKPGRPASFKVRGRIKKFDSTAAGHQRVELSKGGVNKKLFVHRIVAEAFLGPSEGLPVVNHLDCNPKNNRVGNLEWTTYSGNSQHASDAGILRAMSNPNLRQKLSPSDVEEMRRRYWEESARVQDLKDKFGVSDTTVYQVVNFVNWRPIELDGIEKLLTRRTKRIPDAVRISVGTRKLAGECAERLASEFGVSRSFVFKAEREVKALPPTLEPRKMG